MRFNEKLLKSRMNENLNQVSNQLDREAKANSIVEALNFFDAKSEWVDKLNRDEIISLITNSETQDQLIESICEKVNKRELKKVEKKPTQKKSLKESKKSTKKSKKSLKENKEKVQESKQLNEGTSNFYDHNYLPLLVFITYDELEAAIDNDNDCPKYDDFDDDDNFLDALDKFRDEFYDKYYKGVCVLTEEDVDDLKFDLDNFNKDSKEIAYELDIDENGYQEYGDNLNLEDIMLKVEPGYYEGGQIYCENEKYFDYLSEDVKKAQLERFNTFLDSIQKKYGLTKLKTAYRMSNGETGYTIIEELKHLNESVKKTVKFAVPESEMGAIQKKIDDCGFTINSLGNQDGYDEFEVVGDADKEDCWKVVDDLIKEINTHKNVTVANENLQESEYVGNAKIINSLDELPKVNDQYGYKDNYVISVDKTKSENGYDIYTVKSQEKEARDNKLGDDVDVATYTFAIKQENLEESKSLKESDYYNYLDKDYADFLDSDVNVYDVKALVEQETNGEYTTHYSHEYAIIVCTNGKGCVVDYEAVGQDFDSVDSEIEFGIVENKDNEYTDENGTKHKTISLVATHRITTTPKEVMEKAPKKTMKVREFFSKYKYNDRCADNFQELAEYVNKNNGVQESCKSNKKNKKLKEGYIGQTLQDFLDDCIDYYVIDKIYIYGNDDIVYEGSIDEIPDDILNAEFLECEMYSNKRDIVTINVDSSEEYGVTTYYSTVEDFVGDCNNDTVVVWDIATDQEVFRGYKDEIPDDVLDMIFCSYDSPEELSVNLNDYEPEDNDFDDEDDDFDESLKESKPLSEADNKTTFQLSTGNTPILDAGLYYSWLSELDPGRRSNPERFKEFEKAVMEVAQPILNDLVSNTEGFEVVSVDNYFHPKYYNYQTDELDFTVKYNGDNLGDIIEQYSNNEDFVKFLENYKSYDGFISFYADNRDEFITQDYVKSISQIIRYNVTTEQIENANYDLVEGVEDYGFYPEDEEDEQMYESYKSKKGLRESEEIDRQVFTSLVRLGDNAYDGYSILNDGNFVKRIYAENDEDAKNQFQQYIKSKQKNENLKEADDIQTKATKTLSEKKYQIDMAWKNGKTWQTEPMTLKEIGDSVGQSVSEDQFVSMMADNIKNRKDAKNLTKAEIVKLYDYMNGQWKDKEVLWSLNDKTNESLNEDVNTNELADFILKNVNAGLDFDGLAYYELDDDLAVSIGWLEGYDPKDAEFGDIVNEDGYGLNVAITENPSRYAYVDFDYLNQPYDEETGDVWDTMTTLSSKDANDGCKSLADWLIEQYEEIRHALDNGELILNESLKEDTVKQNGKWVNKGNTGETHGEFKTKKEADKQRKAMFVNKKPNAKWGK